ncbi:5943_t:CDS:2 [Gigaspora margarita]|uniref:5943_t:CDS:1 n=1 Tax=Gigaspora margarita TaxID=4874 RepID=A0ABN7UVZ6_GIGMA|nr:5943_t:CDS:2 [Gigaspora margarita]
MIVKRQEYKLCSIAYTSGTFEVIESCESFKIIENTRLNLNNNGLEVIHLDL